jgi:hypothetical protein
MERVGTVPHLKDMETRVSSEPFPADKSSLFKFIYWNYW